MRERAADSAIHQIRRAFDAQSHKIGGGKSRFPPKLGKIDFSSVRQANDAVRLFHEMMAMSPQPSVSVFNKLLSVLAKMEEYATALSVFGKLRQSSIPVNVFTMNITINCCCHVNRVDLGFAVLGSFLKQDYKPDVATFNTLLRGLFSVGKVAKAAALFNKVLIFNLCRPNVVMIGTVTNGLCKSGQPLEALNLLRSFEKASYKPNVFSYSAVIDGLCSVGMVDEALHLLHEMSGKRIQPDAVTYGSIIHGLCSFSRWNEAKYFLMVEMVEHKVPLNVVSLNPLLDAHCKEGKMREAESILELMVKLNVCPDIITYTSMLEGYCKTGNVDEAWHLFQEIPRMGLKLDIFCYNIMIHGFFGEGRFTDGCKLFEDMETLHVHPNLVTYNILINALCKVGKLDDARDLFNSLPSKGFRPDVHIYNTLIDSLYKEGLDEEAKRLLNEMETSDLAPDNVTYNIIVHNLLSRNKVYEAMPVLEEMYSRGFAAHSANMSMLLEIVFKGMDMKLVEVIKKIVPQLK